MCLDILGKVSKIQRYQTFFLEMAGEKVLRGVDSTPPDFVGLNSHFDYKKNTQKDELRWRLLIIQNHQFLYTRVFLFIIIDHLSVYYNN